MKHGIEQVEMSSDLGRQGYIIRSSLRAFDQQIKVPYYSLKIPISGSEHYKIGKERIHVEKQTYLITNPDQEVRAEVDSRSAVNGICIYIDPNIVLDTYQSAHHLFTEDQRAEAYPHILEHSYDTNDDGLGHYIQQIKANIFEGAAIPDAFFLSLSALMLEKRAKIGFQFQQITALKLSTKKELYKRLNHMHQWIQSNYREDVSLDDLAQLIGLSKYHALRLYKRIYGITPYQDVQRLRLKKSLDLLKKHTIEEVSFMLNYSSRRAFSKAFKKSYQCSPMAYQLGENVQSNLKKRYALSAVS